MNRIVVLLLAGLVMAGAVSAKVSDNQEYISRSESERWFVYLDYNLTVFDDLNVRSSGISTTPGNETYFEVDNDNALKWKNNDLMLGFEYLLADNGDEGMTAIYAGAGSAGTDLHLFPSGVIGTTGLNIEIGFWSDLAKFGTLMDKGIALDCSLNFINSEGEGEPDQEYALKAFELNASLVYKSKAELLDTSDTDLYIGGMVTMNRSWLELDMDATAVQGIGKYTLENKGLAQLNVIVGARMFWEGNRTTMDVGFRGSVDGSLALLFKLLQSF